MQVQKYIVASLAIAVSAVSMAPALAMDNPSREGKNDLLKVKQELRTEIKIEKDSLKEKVKEMSKKWRFTTRTVMVTGKVTAVNSASASAPEVTISVTKVGPMMPKSWPTSTVPYPTPSSSLVLKLTDKTSLYRGYWGKMKLAEVAVGDEVKAAVKFNEDGTLNVKWFQDESLHVILRNSGTVESVNAVNGTFVLKQTNRTVTVKTTAATKIKLKPNTAITLNDVKVGDTVHVQGIINLNTKTVAASSVSVAKRVTTVPAANQ